MNSSIAYHISFSEPQAHYVDVILTIENFEQKEYIDLKMPSWAPGSYLIREYAKNVERFQAFEAGLLPIPFEKISKNTWRIFSSASTITVKYHVYAFEKSVRTSFIDSDQAFLSPVGIFMYPSTHIKHHVHINIALPPNWEKISTGLPKVGQGLLYAENFDILYDTPIQLGNQDTWSFDIDGTLHECAMVGHAEYDQTQLTSDITTIVREENKIWGSNPNNYYLFITHNSSGSNGGLEHLNSTILTTSRFNYAAETTYKSYLSLVAHEYFHLWNVKRLRPKALGPFNYDEENYTTALWMMEGFTAYYDNLIIRRCQIYNEDEYLQQLAIDFNTVYNRPGYKIQTAAMASFDAWIKHYRPDENAQNTSISYYNKGAMLALTLDLAIIINTRGTKRFDQVLRAAYEKFYLIENKGFEEHEFQELAEQVSATDLSEIFYAAHHLTELDYNKYLNAVGYELCDTSAGQLSMGIKVANLDSRIIIKHIDRNSAAWQAGLSVDDELIAINNYRIEGTGRALDYVLAHVKENSPVKIILSRDGLIKEISVKVQYSTKKTYTIQRLKGATAEQRALGDIWLSL